MPYILNLKRHSVLMLSKQLVVQFIKFALVGVLGFAFDTALIYLGIKGLGLDPITSAILSFPFTVTVTWLANRTFTFNTAPKASMRQQWLRFIAVCSIGFVVNRGVYSLLVLHIAYAYAHPVLALLGGTVAGMFFNFFASRRLVFLRS